jgi:hypothetical protein
MTSREREVGQAIEEAGRVFADSSPARQAKILEFVREVNRLGRIRADERLATLRAAMAGAGNRGTGKLMTVSSDSHRVLYCT